MSTPTTPELSAVTQDYLKVVWSAREWSEQPVGSVDDVVEMCAPFVRLGYRHLIFGFPSPYDGETMSRLATEVRPRLEALIPH